MTTRKTDEDRLQELEKQIEQMKARKQQVENKIKQKERKERTRRLIQVGAIFEKYFEIEGEEQAEQVSYALKTYVEKNKSSFLNIDLEKSKEKDAIVYKEGVEGLFIPEVKNTGYNTKKEEPNNNIEEKKEQNEKSIPENKSTEYKLKEVKQN
ncbi:Putative conjugal protein TraD like (plasmid) [Sporosarcina sp. ANT_H38]|uniref:hypothetical protein n=1 Tax=Sporosarcina sp. ANT_H38 TaxID=2597358 RepID=UPI00159A1610|nr:hypothetical protein [Sporosarcina sp. ANT_H38]QJS06569.1 putative conjugal protein TraD like [Sporosarcina sp.]